MTQIRAMACEGNSCCDRAAGVHHNKTKHDFVLQHNVRTTIIYSRYQ
jgi:hypothetical protein